MISRDLGRARFESEEEVLAAANDTEYGLAAYFYTQAVALSSFYTYVRACLMHHLGDFCCCVQSLSRAWRVSEGLEYGIVGVNTGVISNEVRES